MRLIQGIPVLTGKAAEEFIAYLKAAKPDPEKGRIIARAKETHRKIKVAK